MAFWDGWFGREKPATKSHQLSSTLVAKEFGEVNVHHHGETMDVSFTILMEPVDSEGWQTGVAIDASGSMEAAYGLGLVDGQAGPPPKTVLDAYLKKGWLQIIEHQGEKYPILNAEAKQDLVRLGHFCWTANDIEPLAARITSYLASNLDADGSTTVIYWACGDGREIEVIGDLSSEDCERAKFGGPQKVSFGQGTCLTPAVRYFADRFPDAKNGIYIFITDGELNDLPEVKRYTIELCRAIESSKRNPLKCVLIGIGENVNEGQMEELDDLDSGTKVDVWDHKVAKDMRALVEIFAEVVSENQIVAPTARIFDDKGTLMRNFTDGLTASVRFSMPAKSQFFELEVGDQRIRQTVVGGSSS